MVSHWKHRLEVSDVFHDDGMPLAEKGKVIAARMRSAPFWPEDDGGELDMLVEELVDAADEDDVEWFDQVWNGIYDWADAERVWINTVPKFVK